MDIGNQQRVIIVELDELVAEEPIAAEATTESVASVEYAAWPLPLDLDLEPVS